jgi:hypothetical protein
MVNTRFPDTRAYGFENVDAAFSACACINRKFTPNRIAWLDTGISAF